MVHKGVQSLNLEFIISNVIYRLIEYVRPTWYSHCKIKVNTILEIHTYIRVQFISKRVKLIALPELA
jgi:hypothetical protein